MRYASLQTDARRQPEAARPRGRAPFLSAPGWRRGAGALALLGLLGAGCRAGGAGIGLAKGERTDDAPANVPVPPADGPKLVAMRRGAAVLERPAEGGRVLGELSVGALVARSQEPYGRVGCPAGWYAVRPRGFVCVGDAVTLREDVAKALPAPPDRARPLPYRYGRARTQGAPAYPWAPDAAAIGEAEPDLQRHLGRLERLDGALGASANDVPLDERGVAVGPPVLMPEGDGVDATGHRTEAGYFVFSGGDVPAPLVPLGALLDEAAGKVAALRKHSGVAITRAVVAGPDGRRFGVTPEGRLVPSDRLQAALGSTWHGIDLDKIGLPVAFVHRYEVHTWSLGRGEAKKGDEELERHTAVPLSGRFRTVDGVRFEEARDGYWLRSQDLIPVVKRSKFPDFAHGSQKWLDVSVANQTVTAYEGQKPIYATLISSGRDQLRDPAESASTVRGTFRVTRKLVTRDIDPHEVSEAYDVADAPWVMEFEKGYALTGMYWSNAVGEAHGFHDVAMTPIDARRLWTWADPEVPEGWHAAESAEGEGTIVSVRP